MASAALQRAVRERAQFRCEYCHFPESLLHELPFNVDHIIAQQHGGPTEFENLALACAHCNRFKGPNLAGIDPDSRSMVPLFHPRTHLWSDHFEWNGSLLIGKSGVGRATIQALRLNRPNAIYLRSLLLAEGWFDPF